MANVMTPERFYRNTVRTGECLIWQGRGRVNGYGTAGFGGKRWLAHRLSLHFARGYVAQNEVVRHSCDTPLCVEPSHLIAGTTAENVADKVQKRRHRFAGQHPMCKLEAAQVAAIRECYAKGGVRQLDLAVQYGVSKSQVSRIVRGERWDSTVKGD